MKINLDMFTLPALEPYLTAVRLDWLSSLMVLKRLPYMIRLYFNFPSDYGFSLADPTWLRRRRILWLGHLSLSNAFLSLQRPVIAPFR